MNTPNKSSILNRRNFLKTTSSVAGATLLGGLSIGRAAFAAGDDTIKIALIGCGGRGTGAANQALNTEGKIKLVAMADTFDNRLKSGLAILKREHGNKVDVPKENQFTGFDAYKQAIAAADVVLLTSPPGFRPMHFEEAVRQGNMRSWKNLWPPMRREFAVSSPQTPKQKRKT